MNLWLIVDFGCQVTCNKARLFGFLIGVPSRKGHVMCISNSGANHQSIKERALEEILDFKTPILFYGSWANEHIHHSYTEWHDPYPLVWKSSQLCHVQYTQRHIGSFEHLGIEIIKHIPWNPTKSISSSPPERHADLSTSVCIKMVLVVHTVSHWYMSSVCKHLPVYTMYRQLEIYETNM